MEPVSDTLERGLGQAVTIVVHLVYVLETLCVHRVPVQSDTTEVAHFIEPVQLLFQLVYHSELQGRLLYPLWFLGVGLFYELVLEVCCSRLSLF